MGQEKKVVSKRDVHYNDAKVWLGTGTNSFPHTHENEAAKNFK